MDNCIGPKVGVASRRVLKRSQSMMSITGAFAAAGSAGAAAKAAAEGPVDEAAAAAEREREAEASQAEAARQEAERRRLAREQRLARCEPGHTPAPTTSRMSPSDRPHARYGQVYDESQSIFAEYRSLRSEYDRKWGVQRHRRQHSPAEVELRAPKLKPKPKPSPKPKPKPKPKP